MGDGSQDMGLVTYTEMPAVVSHEEVFSIVNYNVSDEIDEGYSTNYSPSSKSTSSFECDTSFERAENVSNDIQVCIKTFILRGFLKPQFVSFST